MHGKGSPVPRYQTSIALIIDFDSTQVGGFSARGASSPTRYSDRNVRKPTTCVTLSEILLFPKTVTEPQFTDIWKEGKDRPWGDPSHHLMQRKAEGEGGDGEGATGGCKRLGELAAPRPREHEGEERARATERVDLRGKRGGSQRQGRPSRSQRVWTFGSKVEESRDKRSTGMNMARGSRMRPWFVNFPTCKETGGVQRKASRSQSSFIADGWEVGSERDSEVVKNFEP
ncbi:hypothetical protein B0H16DRAFT_1453955 [Mycena metata]|uniref:Uncharacterized protein n=1 Tax=Mycena metata TaxID=1033252 RepID=A0AAD7JJE3_9AGAR|nr:hypothetical protein B0H16DRAFT_1453955 [Mycena metata]